MKKILLLTLLIASSVYSQNNSPILPNSNSHQTVIDKYNLLNYNQPTLSNENEISIVNNLHSERDELNTINQSEHLLNLEPQILQRQISNDDNIYYSLDSFSTVQFDENSLLRKLKSKFNENGALTLSENKLWDQGTQNFVSDYKTEYYYDENGRETLNIVYTSNQDTQSYIPNNKREYYYDENGRETLNIYYNWDTQTAAFVPSTKDEYGYDENGNQTLRSISNWYEDAQALIEDYRIERAYDENGRVTLNLDYQFEAQNLFLHPSYKYESAFDENGNQTLTSISNWYEDAQALIEDYKSESAYDENGNILILDYVFNQETLNLVPTKRTEYTYRDTPIPNIQNLTQWKIDKYYSELGIYKPSFVKDYSNYLETDTKFILNAVIQEYNTNFNTWNVLEDEEFKSYWYYSKNSSLSLETPKSSEFIIYPNPSSDIVYVEGNYSQLKVVVYDILGKQVMKESITNTLNISQLEKGVYILQLSDGAKVTSERIIKN